ncbi:MAG: class I SAM-dependent methyltransferase [Pyrinomonadaceae bacterium]
MAKEVGIQKVQDFWGTEACGSQFIRDFIDERDFFAQYRQFRYRTEWHIPSFASFDSARDQSVLEIGCGNGADGVMFALHGAHYTGVDLTEAAVEATKRHFAVMGLAGDFRVENAEQLSFADNTFDVVYSYGVIHHTPDPEKALREIYRVLKPGGRALMMLYHQHSFNYYVRVLGYMRLRVLWTIISRYRRQKEDQSRAEAARLSGVRGNTSKLVWGMHYENFLREGWDYLKPKSFVHRCTDGPECPYAYTYSKREAGKLFAAFQRVCMRVGHFPLRKTSGGRLIPFKVEEFLAGRVGWHLLISAWK